METVKSFKYLGYYFEETYGTKSPFTYAQKKAKIAMNLVWGIGERKFKNNYITRMLLFDAMVKSIIMYGAEIWGWRLKRAELEGIQTQYIKWILGLEKSTPNYIVMAESARTSLRTEAIKRAVKYEEKLTMMKEDRYAYQVRKELGKEECRNKNIKWRDARKNVYEKAGLSLGEVRNTRTNGRIDGYVIERLKEIELQERYNLIQKNEIYKRIVILDRLPKYLQEKESEIKQTARLRCGNETLGKKKWLDEEEKKCRLCGEAEESIRHLVVWCRETADLRKKWTIGGVLAEDGSGINQLII